jgi:FkbM family methyltransferase
MFDLYRSWMPKVRRISLYQRMHRKDQAEPCAREAPPLVMAECRYGQMMCFLGDSVIGRSLQVYGEWAEHELSCLRPYIRSGSTVVDVGSNVGSHSLAFARFVQGGKVVAIEAQPSVSAIMEVNRILNGCANVSTVQALCAARSGWTRIRPNYSAASNIGGFSFLPELRRGRMWPFSSWLPPRGGSVVQIRRLDDIVCGSADVSLVKIDVEGMEADVLAGATRILRHCQPVFYMEQLDTRNLQMLHRRLVGHRYKLYWLETQPFNQRNYRNARENLWWRTETGILALPQHAPVRTDLPLVDQGDRIIPSALDARLGWSGTA